MMSLTDQMIRNGDIVTQPMLQLDAVSAMSCSESALAQICVAKTGLRQTKHSNKKLLISDATATFWSLGERARYQLCLDSHRNSSVHWTALIICLAPRQTNHRLSPSPSSPHRSQQDDLSCEAKCAMYPLRPLLNLLPPVINCMHQCGVILVQSGRVCGALSSLQCMSSWPFHAASAINHCCNTLCTIVGTEYTSCTMVALIHHYSNANSSFTERCTWSSCSTRAMTAATLRA